MSFYSLANMSPSRLRNKQRILTGAVAAKRVRRNHLLKNPAATTRALNELNREINHLDDELRMIDLLIGDKQDAAMMERQSKSKFFKEETK